MKTGKSLSIFALMFLSIALIFLACGGGGSGGSNDDIDDSEGTIFSMIIIDDEGGDFSLPNGITLSIPEGAVPEATTFQFRVVSEAELSIPSAFFNSPGKHFLAGFEAMPYGYKFEKPISMTIPSTGLINSTCLPYPLLINTGTNEILNAYKKNANNSEMLRKNNYRPNLKILENLRSDIIQINCEDNSIEIPDLSEFPGDQWLTVWMQIENVLATSDCINTPCRCCGIKIVTNDSESTFNDSCYSAYSEGYVQYLECEGQPIEPWSLEESDLEVQVIPDYQKITVDQITYFSINLTDESSQQVTDFLIKELIIEDASVITEWSKGSNSVGIKGLSPGISSAEILIEAGGCQYKGWLTVEVVEGTIVLTNNSVTIPEGDSISIGVKLSDLPPETPSILVFANHTGGDKDISVEFGDIMLFDDSNWDTYQSLILVAAEDDEDAVDGMATITVSAEGDYYGDEIITAKEADNDNLTGIWLEILTPIENNCEGAELEEDPEPFYLSVTQTDDTLLVQFPGGATATGKIENWNGDGPWVLNFEQQSTSDTTECNAFFADIEAWLGGLPPLNSCVPVFCQETQKMEGTLMEDLKTINGTVDWVFEYQADCTYSGEEPFNYTLSETCEGVDGFVATKQ